MATLKIIRESDYRDLLRAYKIIVDDRQIGEIRHGQTREFPISAGQHQLALRIDWCGSKTLTFSVLEQDIVTFHAGSNLRGAKAISALWYVLFDRDSYLLIEPDSEQLARDAAR